MEQKPILLQMSNTKQDTKKKFKKFELKNNKNNYKYFAT